MDPNRAGTIVDGVWEGVLPAPEGAVIVALHEGAAVEGVETRPLDGGRLSVRVPVPSSALSEGVQTVVIGVNGTPTASFTLAVGVPVEGDVLAELAVLRAELDLLKGAFRRHCRETE